jgi:hypothetical protein
MTINTTQSMQIVIQIDISLPLRIFWWPHINHKASISIVNKFYFDIRSTENISLIVSKFGHDLPFFLDNHLHFLAILILFACYFAKGQGFKIF